MATLSDHELHLAAHNFLSEGMPVDLRSKLVGQISNMPVECVEAQNAKSAAENASDHMLIYANAIDRLLRFGLQEFDRADSHPHSEDLYRAAIMFAGAGLDRALKALVADALPALAKVDEVVQVKLSIFAEAAISDSGGVGVSPVALVKFLLGSGASPREVFAENWVQSLTAGSAQSTQRLEEIAGALGVTEPAIRKRIKATKTKSSMLEKAFVARNQVAHDLDILRPWDRSSDDSKSDIQRRRDAAEIRDYVTELMDVCQLMINDVGRRLGGARTSIQ
ncbi:hypothetical protein [Amycolatopsis sp. DG1A-15b]|uniref:hypothetical protein n=1 Tax=Amycolatopsis sp. DG1A-15b TaxID=3052846 RepID=UPI00255BC2BD|nr:hypothetical protein [Amycolatopsis sp. DG1A-15b]WIX92540.1 hypothetical protein QRY02_19705 [Amycolatopsis sp. DG1A-15b]